MTRILTGLALLASLAIPHNQYATAQQNTTQIKFGERRNHTYETTPLSNDDQRDFRIGGLIRTDSPKNNSPTWGKTFMDEFDLYLWGNLNGTQFTYKANSSANILRLQRNSTLIEFIDSPSGSYQQDVVDVNGKRALAKPSNFFETTRESSSPNENVLIDIYQTAKRDLNTLDANAQWQKLNPPMTGEQLRKSLLDFKRKN